MNKLLEYLTLFAGWVLFFFLFLVISEFFYFVRRSIANQQLKNFAQKNQLEFQPDKVNYRNVLFAFQTSDVTGTWRGYPFKLRHSESNSHRTPGRVNITMYVANPSRGRLRICGKRGTFRKTAPFFRDEWDKKLDVASNPVAFGRHILASTELRERLDKSLNSFLHHHYAMLRVTRDGCVEISVPASMLDTQKNNSLLDLAKDISDLVGSYKQD